MFLHKINQSKVWNSLDLRILHQLWSNPLFLMEQYRPITLQNIRRPAKINCSYISTILRNYKQIATVSKDDLNGLWHKKKEMQYEFKPRVSFNRYKLSFHYKYAINKKMKYSGVQEQLLGSISRQKDSLK